MAMNEELKIIMLEIQRTVATMMKNVWSVSDLALVLGVSEDRVRRMAHARNFPSYKQNGSYYFKRSEIEQWQLQNRIASNDELDSKAALRRVVARRNA